VTGGSLLPAIPCSIWRLWCNSPPREQNWRPQARGQRDGELDLEFLNDGPMMDFSRFK